ncbi:triglyceride lipase Ecym_4027 [Eremothecium cymbalariae DBVPG|uniref:AB hydrolase-1 domain-containing protein n=1 Tax=Eremothecium cymbalariae (strain CBS 270.75 / DBVPG 7215 / KCTC 17166 / NRRL Y-17582) TaxID=931890 RepID=G8JSV7_ERECY|nr:hypothetical protein Ecym_4027 [Eremothecium cymbalariae DBVPG\
MNQIDQYFRSDVRSIQGMSPRSWPESVIDPTQDLLQVVYSVFEPREGVKRGGGTRVNMVFLHGSGMNRALWEYYLVPLWHSSNRSNGCWQLGKVLLIDQVNHGDSAVQNQGKLGVFADWLDGTHDVCLVASKEFTPVGADTVNVIVGHSMGGFQALCSASLYRSLFNLVIALEPVVWMYSVPNVEGFTKMKRGFYKALMRKSRDQFKDEEEYNKFQDEKGFYANAHPDILKRVKEFEKLVNKDGSVSMKTTTYQTMIAYFGNRPSAEWFMTGARFIKADVVTLMGGASKWTPPENEKFLSEQIPNYKMEVVPGGEHVMNLEIPDAIISRIVNHVEEFVQKTKRQEPIDDSTSRASKFLEMYSELERSRVVSEGEPKAFPFKL